MAVPPLAEILRSVRLATVPPSTPTEPAVSPTPMALPALPPLLTSPMPTAPPLADDVATPPLPANCMRVSPSVCPPRGWFPTPFLRHAPPQLAAARPLAYTLTHQRRRTFPCACCGHRSYRDSPRQVRKSRARTGQSPYLVLVIAGTPHRE